MPPDWLLEWLLLRVMGVQERGWGGDPAAPVHWSPMPIAGPWGRTTRLCWVDIVAKVAAGRQTLLRPCLCMGWPLRW